MSVEAIIKQVVRALDGITLNVNQADDLHSLISERTIKWWKESKDNVKVQDLPDEQEVVTKEWVEAQIENATQKILSRLNRRPYNPLPRNTRAKK